MDKVRETLAKNLGVNDFRVQASDLAKLEVSLQVGTQPWLERAARLIFESTTAKLPLALRFPLTSLIKKIRNPQSKVALRDFGELIGVRIVEHILSQQKPKYFYGNHQGAICLTHDVDNAIGWRLTPTVARLNAKHGLPATFNLLTRADYRPRRTDVASLRAMGYEIGLHGLSHDIALAFRSKRKIVQDLKQGVEDLKIKRLGYRSPAFSVSADLFETLSELGFVYDSSIQTASTFYRSSEFHFPYYLEETRVIEIPLTLNDDIFFRDAALPATKILEIFSKTLENVLEIGGVCVINIHPHNLADHLDIYEPILRLIKQKSRALVTTTGQIAELFRAAESS